jgi:hypothetical protein
MGQRARGIAARSVGIHLNVVNNLATNQDQNRFAWGGDGIVVPACNTCANLLPSISSCKAFRLIPREMLIGNNDHTKPYPGDHGIRYEEKK